MRCINFLSGSDFYAGSRYKEELLCQKWAFFIEEIIYSDLSIVKGRLIYICEYMWQKVISNFLGAEDQSSTRCTKDQEL